MDDFEFQSVELTFGPGWPNVSIVTIGIRDDSVFEGREGFSLSLTSSRPRVDFDPQILQVLIVDNEGDINFIKYTYFPPTTLLPCSLVGFNCHKLAPQGYKGKYGS